MDTDFSFQLSAFQLLDFFFQDHLPLRVVIVAAPPAPVVLSPNIPQRRQARHLCSTIAPTLHLCAFCALLQQTEWPSTQRGSLALPFKFSTRIQRLTGREFHRRLLTATSPLQNNHLTGARNGVIII
jgi:hypothetical protein